MIKPYTKLPITICINNDLIDNKLQIPFNTIPIEMISDEGLKYKIGNKIKFFCDKKLNCSIIKEENTEIKIGKIYPARILKAIDGRGLIIDLNISKEIETFVDICEITDFLHYNPLEYYKKGQIVKCRILSKDNNSNRYFASLRNSIIDNEDYDIIMNGSTTKFLQRFSSFNSCDLRNKIMKFGSKDSIELNTIAVGYITSSNEKGLFIKLANNVIVRASLRELTDEISISKPYLLFNVNNICICRVISIYDKNNDWKVNVSLRESVIKYGLILSAKNLITNNFYYCEILTQSKKGFDVNIIGSTFTGSLNNENIKQGSNIEIGKLIILQLIKYEKEDNNTNGNKYKLNFSNLNIDEKFDKNILINPITEQMIKKGEENMEIYHNIKNIIENAKKEKNMNELIDITGDGINENEIDYEELVEKAKKRKNSTNSKLSKNSSNHNKIISENEEEEEEEKKSKSDIEPLGLSKNEVNEMMDELQLFLSFLQSRAAIKETIGQGGQGKIRKYYSNKYQREVVEKIVNLNNCTRGTLGVSGIQSLIKEAVLLAGLDHPNIVKIFDFKPNPPTIIMEYCSKGSLRQILDKRVNLPLKYKIFLIRSICGGLCYVHSKGIVHGDLKCDNILLSDEKKVKIGDYLFPIPKLADFGLGQFGDNNIVGGTPGFIAPEILKGSGLTFKTDIFALGMLMFEILSGLRPIPAQKEVIIAYLAQGKIPCTKEVLRKAYEVKEESLLPGIRNPIYNEFYGIMIECIKEEPTQRPNIGQVYEIVQMLEGALLILAAIL